jgi:hypothetical protein
MEIAGKIFNLQSDLVLTLEIDPEDDESTWVQINGVASGSPVEIAQGKTRFREELFQVASQLDPGAVRLCLGIGGK